MKSGYISLIGRPNAGKSSLVNAIIGQKLALVCKKANATRKKDLYIHMYKDNQMIFIDTPGLHDTERLLNKFMLNEALKAMGDCDIVLFLAPATDSEEDYLKFLSLHVKPIPHILLLTKIDMISQEKLLKKIQMYQKYQDKFLSLVPLNIKKKNSIDYLCEQIVKFLPEHPYLYDPEILTTQNMRDIYKEFIRESIFENTSDEIPYFSDVVINKVIDEEKIIKIYATIIVEKNSQKIIMIGKNATALKRIGKDARILIENLVKNKVFLSLMVIVKPSWSKNKKNLEELGYFF